MQWQRGSTETNPSAKAYKELLAWLSRNADVRNPFSDCSTVFEALVLTVISQQTNEKNTRRVLEELRRAGLTRAEKMASADPGVVEEILKPAGLYRGKSRRLIEAAKKIIAIGGEEKLKEMSSEERLEFLKSLPGVGPKTADVVEAGVFGADVLPVDTHVRRIASRLGILSVNDNYYEARRKLEELTPEGMRWWAHLALIWFGRRICKPRNPRCSECPVKDKCPSRAEP